MGNDLDNVIDDYEKYRREYDMLISPDTLKIEIGCFISNGFLMPDRNGEIKHWAKFRKMDMEHHQLINKFSKREVYQTMNGVERPIISDIDMEELDIHVLRFMLIDWSLCELYFDDNGYLTEESLKQVLQHPAPVIGTFINKYYSTYIITSEDEKIIERQSSILFAKNSRGVDNACDAITLFCMLGNMWEKFGLNYHDLKKMPYKEYVMLRMVLGEEIKRHKIETSKTGSNTRIAGSGGRTRPSRGHVIENPA